MSKVAVALLLLTTALTTACADGDASRPAADPAATTERADDVTTETIYAGTAKSHGAVELSGAVLLMTDGSRATKIEFAIALAPGTKPMPVTGPDGHIEMSYIDVQLVVPALAFFVRETGDGDGLLEAGEIATIRIDLRDACPGCSIGADHTFTLEIKPPNGSYLVIQRTTPGSLEASVDLH